jgi:hypothetical protein
MTELDLLAGLRDEIPLEDVSPGAERLFLAGIEAAPGTGATGRAAARRPRGRWLGAAVPRPRGRLVVAGALSAALAATAVSAGLGLRSGPPGGIISVTELAYRAAAAASRQPPVRPGQWVYRVESIGGGRDGVFEVWTTADSAALAYVDRHGGVHVVRFPGGIAGNFSGRVPTRGGHTASIAAVLGRLQVPYAGLGALPRSPRALLRYLAGQDPSRRLFPAPASEFATIGSLIAGYVMPPGLTAELYRALGDIPGVTVEPHAVDAAGRPGVGFVHACLLSPPGTRTCTEEIIINPRTYRLMGERFSPHPSPHGPLPEGVAYLREALVPGPGVRP